MKFVLTNLVAGKSPILEITQDDYEAINDSDGLIYELVLMEQKYDNIIENYLEYENYLIEVSHRHMVNRDFVWSGERQASNTIQRRIMNVLNSSYAFIQQSKHHLKMIFPEDIDKIDNYDSFLNQQYDKYLGYRVMVAIRNHSQHFNFPAQHLALSMKRVNRGVHNRLLISATPSISITGLSKNKKFKRKILTELKEIGDIIDIKPLLREYIACTSRIIMFLRDTTEKIKKNAGDIYYMANGRIRSMVSDATLWNPVAAILNRDKTVRHKVIINIERILLRQQYEKKNCDLSSLNRHFASGEVIEDS